MGGKKDRGVQDEVLLKVENKKEKNRE